MNQYSTSSLGASESVEAVRFSFMTEEEVRRHSVIKITNPNLLDSVQKPLSGGLYDPALGPLDDQAPCKSCGQRSFHCPGHCGHIDLVLTVYNPLLFDTLYNLLQRTCFFCCHFKASRHEVNKCASQLELIAKGDIIGAKRFDSTSPSESLQLEDSSGSQISYSMGPFGAQDYRSEPQKRQAWTSLQLTQAMSALHTFMKLKPVKCANCKAKNPKISKPTFGWLHMSDMSGAQTRSNVIRDCKLKPFNGETEKKPSSEVVNGNEHPWKTGGFDTAESNLSSDGIEESSRKAHMKKGVRVPVEFSKQKKFFSGPILPSEVKVIVKRLWENEAQLCSFICDIQQVRGKIIGHSMFFLEALLVPPIKFRPATNRMDSVMEHPHTVLLGKVLQSNIALGNARVNNSESSKLVSRWMDLQQSVNVLFDSKTAIGQGQRDVSSGISQLLEKKEGVFRQKMMGKRVNYACRSVISPDPYLAVNEIGIPPYFALRLTYPERVTHWNAAKLRDAIISGPEVHPGATHYADKVSTVRLPPSKKMRISISRKVPSSRGVITQSAKVCDYEFEGKTVYRHLRDGDIVLVNRQPTLHKPSIMAHVVRVLKGEKTLRMHYANCSTYNADFDGDEMNVHLPQDEVSRAEAYNIVNANNQYIIPTRGDTARGLIQDHIVSAVLLTMKNTFLTHDEYNQLLYGSGVFAAGRSSFSGNPSRKISLVDSEGVMLPVLPAVWKPKPLWTGKQVITAVLNHLTRGYPSFNVEREGKIPYMYFASMTDQGHSSKDEEDNAENKLLIRRNELLHGVIDKAQFGKYGLVHTVQELYGSNSAGILLSVLSRLFTIFLQIHGFTCGVDDLMISPSYDEKRKNQLEGEDVGRRVHSNFLKFKDEIGSTELQLETEKAIRNNGQSAIAYLDMKMRNEISEKINKNQINQKLLLKGLLKPFPKNCISLMTISGAKGSTVNFQQISSFLGQQELEGKRVPRMISGKTLPCFPPWDFASRAGGFITDRFLTGLRPQEYYFHCMAGREGLNTFHLAGRGDGNVTLGIPRLQEILMTASNDNKAPIMTCPLLAGRTKEHAEAIVAKLKEVTVADVIDQVEVRVLPLAVHNNQTSSIYKLTIKLKEQVPVDDCNETLEVVFLRELEDAIDSHLILLSKIRGIKNFMSSSQPKASDESGEDASGSRSEEGNDDDDDDDDDKEKADEYLGSDAQKRKQQTTDEMDYEDGSEDEPNEEEPSAEPEKENDHSEDGVEIRDDGEIMDLDDKEETSEVPHEYESVSDPKSGDRKSKSKSKKKENVGEKFVRKENDRAIFVAAKGLHFEVHFRFTNEPHILLAQIAQKTAKKVCVKSSGKIGQCRIVKHEASEKQVIWENDGKESDSWALETAGVDFSAFWDMEGVLDFRRVYSNNIHAILNTYGVEAARDTIIREVKHVFEIYGVEVDHRHLSLIGDYMTHSGGYRPMSRHGGIAESVSPFIKMSFETASKFIVEAASYGMSDDLETPSARICLGLPVKMGTGSFDLMQKLEI